MKDERFYELALKAYSRECTAAEQAELDSLLASRPELKTEFEQLKADARLVREALPLMEAIQSSTGEFPAYARERLQTKVRQTLGPPQPAKSTARERGLFPFWSWRWTVGLASAAAVVVLVFLAVPNRPSGSVIQVAVLDMAGATRGSGTDDGALLRQTWEKATVDSFASEENLRAWGTNWPSRNKRPIVKIVFDKAAGEVRVLGRWEGKSFEKTFLVEKDLAATLMEADAFVKANTVH